MVIVPIGIEGNATGPKIVISCMRRCLNVDFKKIVLENRVASFSTITSLFWSREEEDKPDFNQS